MKPHFFLAILFSILCILTQPGEAFVRDGRGIQREKRTFPMSIPFLEEPYTRQSPKPQVDRFKFVSERGELNRVTSCVPNTMNRYSI